MSVVLKTTAGDGDFHQQFCSEVHLPRQSQWANYLLVSTELVLLYMENSLFIV